MAITQIKKDSLVDTKIIENSGNDPKKNNDSQPSTAADSNNTIAAKRSFLATTIDELKKVNWPSAKYTATWTGVILLFTLIFSLFLGLFDHVFTAGVQLINCTSQEGEKRPFNECAQEFGKRLISTEKK